MTPTEYSFDLGIGDVSAEGAINNTFALLPMSVPDGTAEEKKAMNFWLNHGLVWMYSFNHEEAIKCFQRALDISALCIFGHWGISLCHGPNYNTQAMSRDSFPSAKEAYAHARRVSELLEVPAVSSALSSVENAVLSALSCRFNPVTDDILADALIDANTAEYTTALEKVYTQFPSNACVASLYAESLMNFSPWKLWNLETGAPEPHALRAKEVLERAIRRFPHHPGLNHFVVHLMEMSPTPQAALPSCDVLRFHFPDAGHLIHMPSHIYVLLGMYDQAAACNIDAIAADDKYVEKEGIYNCYTGYRIHNIHFVSYAAMFAGQYEVAMEAALQIRKNVPDDMLSNPFMAKYFEAFLSIEWHVLVRFGRWAEILSRPIPEVSSTPESFLYPYTLTMQHYARGIAHAVLSGQEQRDGSTLDAAKRELSLFRTAAENVPADRVLHNNTCSSLVAVGEAMLQGEIQYRGGSYDAAFDHLREAIRLSDALVYDEPWGWMQPPRHALGALLLEQGGGSRDSVQQAEALFRQDMDPAFTGRCHPDNLWALSGLARCLELHPEEYDGEAKKEVDDENVTQDSASVTASCTIESSSIHPNSTEMDSSQQKASLGSAKHANLKLDWAHIADTTSTTLHQPCNRTQELADVRRKLSAIKAIARKKVSEQVSGEANDSGEERPWLSEGITVAACLCAKSVVGGTQKEGVRSIDHEDDACCKRQKLC